MSDVPWSVLVSAALSYSEEQRVELARVLLGGLYFGVVEDLARCSITLDGERCDGFDRHENASVFKDGTDGRWHRFGPRSRWVRRCDELNEPTPLRCRECDGRGLARFTGRPVESWDDWDAPCGACSGRGYEPIYAESLELQTQGDSSQGECSGSGALTT